MPQIYIYGRILNKKNSLGVLYQNNTKPHIKMQSIKSQLSTNLAPWHYLAYCLSFMTYGCVITGLGPLIPYLSAQTGYMQTEYSFLFFSRALGFLSGAIMLRFLQKKMAYHTILFWSSVLLLVLMSMFSYVLGMREQGVLMFCISAMCCCLQVTINVSTLEIQKHSELEFWMLVLHGLFGIGGLVGPIFVYFFELRSFMVMGILIVLIAPSYCILHSPQNHDKISQKVSKQGLLQQIKNLGHQGPYPVTSPLNQTDPQHKLPRKPINPRLQLLISFMFLLYIGLQCSFGSWIASYAVLQDISSKQQATQYSSIFWISITVFRFLTVCLPFKSLKKLFLLAYGYLAFSLLTLLMVYIDYKPAACVFSAITFGMCFSSMFPLLLAIPTDYNLDVSAAQGANFMMWCAFGQAILATVVGYSMAWFDNDSLFQVLFLMGLAFVAATHLLKLLYENDAQNTQKTDSKEIELKKVNFYQSQKTKYQEIQLKKVNLHERDAQNTQKTKIHEIYLKQVNMAEQK